MKTKTFPLDQILSITTGRLLVQMDGVYELLNHVTGDSLFTHVLPRANRFAAPLILAQHPELAKAGTPEALAKLNTLLAAAKARNEPTGNACAMWVKWIKEPSGLNLKEHYEVSSHEDQWLSMHPMEEPILQGKNVIVVKAD